MKYKDILYFDDVNKEIDELIILDGIGITTYLVTRGVNIKSVENGLKLYAQKRMLKNETKV